MPFMANRFRTHSQANDSFSCGGVFQVRTAREPQSCVTARILIKTQRHRRLEQTRIMCSFVNG